MRGPLRGSLAGGLGLTSDKVTGSVGREDGQGSLEAVGLEALELWKRYEERPTEGRGCPTVFRGTKDEMKWVCRTR